jgi:hypothetical protein
MRLKTPLLFSLLVFIAEEGDNFSLSMFSVFSSLIYAIVSIVAPILLFYAFLRGALDVFKSTKYVKLTPLLLIAQTEQLSKITEMFTSLTLIIVPLTLILLVWKLFLKVVKL